jgi:uncharacterized membrane protein YdjX (TVP38/TMEM64 family)
MKWTSARRSLVAVALALAIAAAWYVFRARLSINELIDREAEIRSYIASNFAVAWLTAFAIYVLATALSLPIATGLTLLYAWFFGFWPALVLVSFASTAGATLTFLASRFLLLDWVQRRFGTKLATFNAALARDGAFYLFTLRLLIVVPFWLVNLLMGLTTIGAGTFWWVSQLGMLPATVVYVWTGANLPSIEQVARQGVLGVLDWKLIAGLAALGLFPWVARAVVRWKGRRVSG